MKWVRIFFIVLTLCLVSLSSVAAQSEPSRTASPRIAAPNSPNVYVRDGSFEQMDGSWAENSTSFGGIVICSSVSCPNANNTSGPYSGGWYAWFGGTTAAQTSSINQSVYLPKQGMTVLEFYYWVGFSTGVTNADLSIYIGQSLVETMNIDASMAGYVQKRIDISNYGAGENYTLSFVFTKNAGAYVDLSLDSIQINYGITYYKTDFETTPANGWTVSNPTGDKRICNTDTVVHSYVQNCAFMFRGNAGEASNLNVVLNTTTRQEDVLPLPSARGNARVVNAYSAFAGMFVKSTGATPNLTLTLTVVLASGDKVTVKNKITTPFAAYDWVQTNPAAFLAYDLPSRFTIRVSNRATGGKVYIDDLQLAYNINVFTP